MTFWGEQKPPTRIQSIFKLFKIFLSILFLGVFLSKLIKLYTEYKLSACLTNTKRLKFPSLLYKNLGENVLYYKSPKTLSGLSKFRRNEKKQ